MAQRPAEPDPSGATELLLPRDADVEPDLLVARAAATLERRVFADDVVGQPRLDVGAELFVGETVERDV